jgi:tRNA(adenine34) deaminase
MTIRDPASLDAAVAWSSAMQEALAEADAASLDGDVPVGAVILDRDGRLLGRGRNRREVDADPTAHAEIVAMREAARQIGHWRLLETTLVVTLEPCLMCAGALINARVARVVYGADDPKAGAVRSLFRVADDPRLNHRLEIVSGVEKEACASRLRLFFARLRAEGQK